MIQTAKLKRGLSAFSTKLLKNMSNTQHKIPATQIIVTIANFTSAKHTLSIEKTKQTKFHSIDNSHCPS
jgi:hypothetical protein